LMGIFIEIDLFKRLEYTKFNFNFKSYFSGGPL